jgi:PAS domain S-box-containing protein
VLAYRHSSIFSRLRGLLEVTRLVRTEEELPELLAAIARTVSESLGFHTVVVNRYRREWDDFEVTTVHGSDEARDALLGRVRQVEEWERLLDARFLERGAYVVPHGEFDWQGHDAFTPDLPVSDDPGSWHPEDALFVPMRAADGSLLGVLSVDEPASGRRPTGDEIDVLVAVAEHAAIALQAAQDTAKGERRRAALERLLEVSTRLNETWQTEELLQLVCEAISDALGFGKVAVELLDVPTHLYVPGAAVGFRHGAVPGAPISVAELELLLRPEFEVEGCYVIPDEAARELLPDRPAGYVSVCDGRGPHSWQNHWLFVPLHDRRGLRIGFIWVDDPRDRLRPTPDRLQLLRAFANQAATALTAAAHLEALKDSNERHRSLINASPAAIVDFDLDGRVRTWNAAAVELFGWTAEETVGRINPLVRDDEVESFLARIDRIREGETLRDSEATRTRRDGSEIDLSVSTGPVRNGQGEVVGVVSLLVDVGERKRSQRAVLASEARKDAILRSALDSVVTVDHEGRIVEFNPAAEEILGWTADATGAELVELAIAEEHRPALAEVLASGKGPLLGSRYEIVALRADRRSFPAEISIYRVDVPGPALFAVSIRDITKRKDREERMREAEAKYRTLVEQLPLATFVNDTGLPVRTRYMSPQIEQMLGYPAADWLAPDFFRSVIHPEDRARVMAEGERTHRTGETFECEYRMIAADGRVVWVLDETVAVRDAEYRPLFLQGFLLDVTHRRLADEALRQSEELYRGVIESSSDLIAVIDLDGTARYVSPSVRAILGWLPEELVGQPYVDRIHPEDASAVVRFFDDLAAGGPQRPITARVDHADGGWVTLEGRTSVIRDEDGRPTGLVMVSRPVARFAALHAVG